MENLVLGIDIGGTNTVFGVVNSSGEILFRDKVSTTQHAEPEMLMRAIHEKISASSFQGSFQGIGIGAPNGNFYTGTIEFAPNLKWSGIVPLAEIAQTIFGVPCKLTNDANAATLGEMIFGSAKGMNDFLFITLGTGLGSGIVANGGLIYGHDGFAGELGHVIIDPQGRDCGCGRRGCLETYCSATGLIRTYKGLESSAPENCTSQYVFEQAEKGDVQAIRSFDITGKILGLALANSVAYTSPEAIFLFGGLANAGERLFAPVRESFERNLLNIYKNKIRIHPSGLPENDAAILGAASLMFH